MTSASGLNLSIPDVSTVQRYSIRQKDPNMDWNFRQAGALLFEACPKKKARMELFWRLTYSVSLQKYRRHSAIQFFIHFFTHFLQSVHKTENLYTKYDILFLVEIHLKFDFLKDR